MLQPQKQSQQSFLGESEFLHVRARRRAAQHSRQRNNQNFQQIVARALWSRGRQGSKSLPEVPHPTPSLIRESPSESSFGANTIETSNPNALPLPLAGRTRPPRKRVTAPR